MLESNVPSIILIDSLGRSGVSCRETVNKKGILKITKPPNTQAADVFRFRRSQIAFLGSTVDSWRTALANSFQQIHAELLH